MAYRHSGYTASCSNKSWMKTTSCPDKWIYSPSQSQYHWVWASKDSQESVIVFFAIWIWVFLYVHYPFIYVWYTMKYRNSTDLARYIQIYPDIEFIYPSPIVIFHDFPALDHLRPFRGFGEVHRGGARSSSSDAIGGGLGGPDSGVVQKILGLLDVTKLLLYIYILLYIILYNCMLWYVGVQSMIDVCDCLIIQSTIDRLIKTKHGDRIETWWLGWLQTVNRLFFLRKP